MLEIQEKFSTEGYEELVSAQQKLLTEMMLSVLLHIPTRAIILIYMTLMTEEISYSATDLSAQYSSKAALKQLIKLYFR